MGIAQTKNGPEIISPDVIRATYEVPYDDQGLILKQFQIRMSGVPEGWEERTSRSTGQTYFLNVYTKQSQWDKPTSPAIPAPTQVLSESEVRAYFLH